MRRSASSFRACTSPLGDRTVRASLLAASLTDVPGVPAFVVGARSRGGRRRYTPTIEQVLGLVDEIVLIADADGLVIWANPAAVRALGYAAGDRVDPRRGGGALGIGLDERLLDAAQTGLAQRGEIIQRGPGGRLVHLAGHVTPIRDSDGRVAHCVLIAEDVTGGWGGGAAIESLACTDALTGLVNRRGLMGSGRDAVETARANGETAALLYVDLDRLKWINDTLGHAAGDELLVGAARRLRGVLRPRDLLARVGGDEFVFVVTGLDGSEVDALVERVRHGMTTPFHFAGRALRIGASVGVALFPEHALEFDGLLQAADMAMYHAKRNQLGAARYDADLGRRVRQRARQVQELQDAVARRQLRLALQPVRCARSGTVRMAEALVRWARQPGRPPMLPGAFLPAAEECGVILDIDRWVLRASAKYARELRDARLPCQIAVNLSPRTFEQLDMPTWVDDALRDAGIPGDALIVEITESTALQGFDGAVRQVAALAERGIRVVLDDFGTGYSSLARLKHLRVDGLKIDRSFVAGIGEEPRDESMIEVMLLLARNLGMRVVAEGVETPAQARWLAERGCDELQGYLLGRPMAAPAFAEWLACDRPSDRAPTPMDPAVMTMTSS